MLEFLGIFTGVFLTLVTAIALYRYLFDRPRWDKAVTDARAAGSKRREEGRVKIQAAHQRNLEKTAERKAKAEVRQEAKKERLRLEQEALRK